jgi:CheY-like chemotaxis protein
VEQDPKVVGRFVTLRDGPQTDTSALRAGASRRVESHPGPFRILLAEDDDEMRCVLADALRRDGYDVVELADGEGFLEMAARLGVGADRDLVDLIVSDVRMPVCGGLEVLSALRNACCHVPVILMTAFGDEATRRHAARLSAVLFDKPFDLDDLRTAARSLLAGDPPGR